jgi:hypothetical protein
MKNSFTAGIIAFVLIWAVVLFILIFKATRENVDLVAKDYYNKEIAFQDRIDKENNVASLSAAPHIRFMQDQHAVEITFPADFRSKSLKGSVHFFRPDDSARDFTVTMESDTSLTHRFSFDERKKGFWRVQVDWDCENVSYFAEGSFHVN